MSAVSAALILLAAGVPPAPGGLPHDEEIKLFASTMAIAKMVKAACPSVDADDQFLEMLRLRLHVVEADRAAFAPQARAATDVLKQALDAAPSRTTWCDAVFRLYGPDGKLMRGMLRRR